MKKLKLLMANLIQPILSLLALNNKREILIIIAVLTGMFTQYLLFGNNEYVIKKYSELFYGIHNYYYYTKYTINFFHSSFFLTVCIYIANKVFSARLIFMIGFILLSMTLDFGSIWSIDFFKYVRPFRYEGTVNLFGYHFKDAINFKEAYLTLEVIIVIFKISTIDRAYYRIKRTIVGLLIFRKFTTLRKVKYFYGVRSIISIFLQNRKESLQ